MRKIKFRAWNSSHILEWDWICAMGMVSEIILDTHVNYQIMQFTGLLDKNGKEIYEGDIAKDTQDSFGRNSLISWSNNLCGFWKEPIVARVHQFGQHLEKRIADRIEVIGNIYENPELLTKEENNG